MYSFGILENEIDKSKKDAQENSITTTTQNTHENNCQKLDLSRNVRPGAHFKRWVFYESIYYSIVADTTVGYCDLSPRNMWTRLAAYFYLPPFITIMANVFGQIMTPFGRMKEIEAEFFRRKLTLKDSEEMDFGGDGNVNSEEFLIFGDFRQS